MWLCLLIHIHIISSMYIGKHNHLERASTMLLQSPVVQSESCNLNLGHFLAHNTEYAETRQEGPASRLLEPSLLWKQPAWKRINMQNSCYCDARQSEDATLSDRLQIGSGSDVPVFSVVKMPGLMRYSRDGIEGTNTLASMSSIMWLLLMISVLQTLQ